MTRLWSHMVLALPSMAVQAMPANPPVPRDLPEPATMPAPLGGDVEANYRLFGWHNCNTEEKKAITEAFGEKDTITGIDSAFDINWKGSLAIDYLGYVLYI
jgi:hypothetical protein